MISPVAEGKTGRAKVTGSGDAEEIHLDIRENRMLISSQNEDLVSIKKKVTLDQESNLINPGTGMEAPRYLTKSRFKLACECETKLYYTKKALYADQSVDDPFLLELAKGGYQVGELAKYYFTDDAANITVGQKAYENSLEETSERIERGDSLIAEAALRYGNLFIRTDILWIDTVKKMIHIYEVKSKSWSSSDVFITAGKKGDLRLSSTWKPYLMDVAFQKYVTIKAYPGYSVSAFLMLVNKEAKASVDGLNQFFKVCEDGNSYKVVTNPGLTRAELGEEVLKAINVDNEIDFIWNRPAESSLFSNYSFADYVEALAEAYEKDEKLNTPVSKECKLCQFYTKPGDQPEMKSGIKECWKEKLGIAGYRFTRPKVIDLWGGKAGAVSVVQKMIDSRKYFMDDIDRADISDNIPEMPEGELSPPQRRWEQVRRIKAGIKDFYLDKPGLKDEMDRWNYPLHFIDFETSSPALPFTRGAHPYEGIAFQYSHHSVIRMENGSYRVVHTNQFLRADPGVNPNLDFIRELKRDLSGNNGTIFRYHNHENTYLRKIYGQIMEDYYGLVTDKEELLSFIDSITQYGTGGNRIRGRRNMVDMWDLVLRFYYSPFAGGSNSLKQILPAAIHDSQFLRNKYSHPVCGKNKPVTSLNFESKIWIDEAYGNDPYKTLPEIFEGFTSEQLDEIFSEFDEVKDGGAAMMAYAKLQFFNTNEDQREAIRQALYRYCELDTLAMVMLWEFWNDEIIKDK